MFLASLKNILFLFAVFSLLLHLFSVAVIPGGGWLGNNTDPVNKSELFQGICVIEIEVRTVLKSLW